MGPLASSQVFPSNLKLDSEMLGRMKTPKYDQPEWLYFETDQSVLITKEEMHQWLDTHLSTVLY